MRRDCERAAAGFQLALPRGHFSGPIGEHAGHGTGSSLEFMDFRAYVPGDDLRHVNWRSFARSEKLHVQLFRAEVTPILEIVADNSLRMGVTLEKELALRDLVAAFTFWGEQRGMQVRTYLADGHLHRSGDQFSLQPAGHTIALDHIPLRPRSLRVFLSDCLFDEDPVQQLRRFCQGASAAWVVQLLDQWELHPTVDHGMVLVDAETGESLEVHRSSIAEYQTKLNRLCETIAKVVQQQGGRAVCLLADTPRRMFDALLAAAVLEPV